MIMLSGVLPGIIDYTLFDGVKVFFDDSKWIHVLSLWQNIEQNIHIFESVGGKGF